METVARRALMTVQASLYLLREQSSWSTEQTFCHSRAQSTPVTSPLFMRAQIHRVSVHTNTSLSLPLPTLRTGEFQDDFQKDTLRSLINELQDSVWKHISKDPLRNEKYKNQISHYVGVGR